MFSHNQIKHFQCKYCHVKSSFLHTFGDGSTKQFCDTQSPYWWISESFREKIPCSDTLCVFYCNRIYIFKLYKFLWCSKPAEIITFSAKRFQHFRVKSLFNESEAELNTTVEISYVSSSFSSHFEDRFRFITNNSYLKNTVLIDYRKLLWIVALK